VFRCFEAHGEFWSEPKPVAVIAWAECWRPGASRFVSTVNINNPAEPLDGHADTAPRKMALKIFQERRQR